MGDSGHRRPLVAAVAALGLLAAASCSGDDEPDGSGPAPVELDVDGRCDLAFNTAAYNDATAAAGQGDHAGHQAHTPGAEVDFGLEDWAEVFVDEGLGASRAEVVAELAGARSGAGAAGDAETDVYRRHILGGVLTHRLAADPWAPMSDPGECAALADELGRLREAVAGFPTVADAEAAGYTQGDTYYAGLGVHYQNWSLLSSEFDPARPVQLLYGGTDPGSHLVGVSYVVNGTPDTPPEGFTGANDVWHRHRSFCLDEANRNVNLSSDVLSDAECTALGGTPLLNDAGWMLHTWVVPGCESDWGIFSGANPRLPYLPDGVTLDRGCNSGRSATDGLDLDDRGSGPRLEEVTAAG